MRLDPSQHEMRRIFEKSVRLLDSSQSQLHNVRHVLKRAVNQLSALNTGKHERINDIVCDIKNSVERGIDTDKIEGLLDDFVGILSKEEYLKANDGNILQLNLERILESSLLQDVSGGYSQAITELLEADLSEDGLAEKLMHLFVEVAKSQHEHKALSERQLDAIRQFSENIAELADVHDHTNLERGDEILSSLYADLRPYLSTMRPTSEDDFSDGSMPCDESSDINHLLIDLVNMLSLHSSVGDARSNLVVKLGYPVRTLDQWRDVIDSLIDVVNRSLEALESEKTTLQEYIAKVISQLNDIETYVKKSRDRASEAFDMSARLSNTVQSDVDNINHVVEECDDIESLKQDVQVHLGNIRQSVIENQRTAEERDLQSLESYTTIISELMSTQRESENLKQQLTDSHARMLQDELTGLPNRIAFNERIASEYQRWKRDDSSLSLAIWDIDNFKKFNDDYGHHVGDRVLKIAAKIIHSSIRKIDMFARYGGEEFVCLMPDTTLEAALQLNDELREKLAAAGFHYDGVKCLITSSVGIASFREGDTIEDVMKRADIALYESKDAGKNCCTVESLA